jgi:hypothetical protein
MAGPVWCGAAPGAAKQKRRPKAPLSHVLIFLLEPGTNANSDFDLVVIRADNARVIKTPKA